MVGPGPGQRQREHARPCERICQPLDKQMTLIANCAAGVWALERAVGRRSIVTHVRTDDLPPEIAAVLERLWLWQTEAYCGALCRESARPSLPLRQQVAKSAREPSALVRSRGLEPPRVAPLAPQASASTNSATTACGVSAPWTACAADLTNRLLADKGRARRPGVFAPCGRAPRRRSTASEGQGGPHPIEFAERRALPSPPRGEGTPPAPGAPVAI
jgi:hypothetical protein